MIKPLKSFALASSIGIALTFSGFTTTAQAGNLTDLLDSIEACMEDFFENPNDRAEECTGGPAPRIEIRGFTPPPPPVIACKVISCECRRD